MNDIQENETLRKGKGRRFSFMGTFRRKKNTANDTLRREGKKKNKNRRTKPVTMHTTDATTDTLRPITSSSTRSTSPSLSSSTTSSTTSSSRLQLPNTKHEPTNEAMYKLVEPYYVPATLRRRVDDEGDGYSVPQDMPANETSPYGKEAPHHHNFTLNTHLKSKTHTEEEQAVSKKSKKKKGKKKKQLQQQQQQRHKQHHLQKLQQRQVLSRTHSAERMAMYPPHPQYGGHHLESIYEEVREKNESLNRKQVQILSTGETNKFTECSSNSNMLY
eukprot:m.144172 g.144172  ORF g.144172 m.144172 type:complete len:274 (+) comp13220_c0_seq1:196-1017(+)